MEDHLALGGLASSIADVFVDEGVRPKAFRRLGIPQVYAGFGPAEQQWAKYEYDRAAAAAAVRLMLA
jgi:transketolase